MYRSLAGLAAVGTLAAFVTAGPAVAAEQRQAPGIQHDQQNVTEEFSSQRRYRRYRHVRRWVAPRYRYARPYRYVRSYRYARPYRYVRTYPYAYASPYPYAYPYAYARPYYPGPYVSFGFGPFAFGIW